MRPAFPTSDYYESSARSLGHQLTTSLPAADLAGRRGGQPKDRSHVHCLTDRRVRRPAFPRQHRHEYAAGLPRGLPAGPADRLRSRPGELRRGVHCWPAHIHQVGAGSGLAGVRPLVPALVHLPVSLAGPGPSGSAGPSRRCQGCSHPPLRLQDRAALSFSGPLRRPTGGVLSPPHGQTAPRGAPPAANTPRSPTPTVWPRSARRRRSAASGTASTALAQGLLLLVV